MARPGRPNKSDIRIDEMKLDIEKGHNEKVKQLLLEAGIDACDDYLRTALIWSPFFNNIHLLNWVINSGANANHQDKNGYSALHFAAQDLKI